MNATTLNGFKASATRARTTILGHNSILWNKDGAIARQDEELQDLSPEEVTTDVGQTIDSENPPYNLRWLRS